MTLNIDSKRFFVCVEIPRDNPELCWTWYGFRNRDGYGRTGMGRKYRLAHRVSYELLVGPIADGLTLDHLCRNKACVNPSHLDLATALENYFRGVVAQTHCRNGHAYTETSHRITGGIRICRICERARIAAYHERRETRAS